MKWIKTRNVLPESGKEVLVYSELDNSYYIATLFKKERPHLKVIRWDLPNDWIPCFVDNYEDRDWDTYWMFLPISPLEDYL